MVSASSPNIQINAITKASNDVEFASQLASGDWKAVYASSTNTDVVKEADYYQYFSMGMVKVQEFNAGALVKTYNNLNWGSQMVLTSSLPIV